MDTTEGSIHWRKSSRCETGACVEVARIDGMVAIRNSEDAALLIFSPDEWTAFVAGVRDGEFD